MDFNVITPETKPALLKAMRLEKNYRFGAGYTDLILELKKQNTEGLTVINLAQLKDKNFTSIEKIASGLRIGVLTTAAGIVQDKIMEKNFPVLKEAANHLASSQIRQVATLGGNLCTASPSGDVACALVALNAECEILSVNGKLRVVPISGFFVGPRKTVLNKNEVLRSVKIPWNEKSRDISSGFIKIGTRRSMECSVVSFAYHIQVNKKGIVTQAGIAIGAAAPTIRLAEEADFFLKGKNIRAISQHEKEAFAQIVLQYASPISDIRASAWYRKEVLFNISKSIFENK